MDRGNQTAQNSMCQKLHCKRSKATTESYCRITESYHRISPNLSLQWQIAEIRTQRKRTGNSKHRADHKSLSSISVTKKHVHLSPCSKSGEIYSTVKGNLLEKQHREKMKKFHHSHPDFPLYWELTEVSKFSWKLDYPAGTCHLPGENQKPRIQLIGVMSGLSQQTQCCKLRLTAMKRQDGKWDHLEKTESPPQSVPILVLCMTLQKTLSVRLTLQRYKLKCEPDT